MTAHSLIRKVAPVAGAVLLLLSIASLGFAAPERGDEARLSDWITEMERGFAAHPEIQDRPGHGWKPFNRFKWFYEQRMYQGQDPPVGARWQAWELKKDFRPLAEATARAPWFALGPTNVAGRILALEFDPTNSNILYAGSASGGLWKSTDAGQSWAAITDDLPSLAIGGVAVLPGNPNVVVIATGEATINIDRVAGVGILRSTDAGASWISTSLGYAMSQGHGFHFVESNPINGTLLAGATNGLWRSTDEGANWTLVKDGGDYYDGAWKPGNANTCFVAKGDDSLGNNVKISTDDGLTWDKAGTGQPLSLLIGKTKIAMSADDPNTIYALYAEPTFPSDLVGLYRSTDGGATWMDRGTSTNIPGGQGWYNLSLAADPNDIDRVIAGGVNVFRSTDGGATFASISGAVHVDHHAIAYRPGSPDDVFVGTDGGIWESTADGSSWQDRNTGLVTYQFYDICVNNHTDDPNFIMGGTQDQGTDKWSGTTTWAEGLGGDGMVCNINPMNGRAVYAEVQFGSHYKNTNYGLGGWTSINSGLTGDGYWVAPVDEDQTVGAHLYTATSGASGGICRTTDGAASWVKVASHTGTWISISRVDGDVVWTSGSTVMVTTDDGGSWSSTASFPFTHGTITKILAHPADVNTAFVTFSDYVAGHAHVARTTNMGASWENLTGDLPSQPVNVMAIDPLNTDLWFIGTDIGVWYSTNEGTNWLPYDAGLPNVVIADLEIQTATQKLFAGTHGRGAWEVEYSDLLSIESPEGDVAIAPSPTHDMKLDRPYPNPAIDATTLRFAARYEGEVHLEIYDVRGRFVHEVARLPRGDGIIRNARWYPDDVPNGVYFAVLRVGEDRLSRKVIVAR